jgi:reverse gyrase
VKEIFYPIHRDSHGNIVKTVPKKTYKRFCWNCGEKYFGRMKQGSCDKCLKKSSDKNVSKTC